MANSNIRTLLVAGILLANVTLGTVDVHAEQAQPPLFPPIDSSRVDCTAFRTGNEAECYKTANEVYQLNLLILSQYAANDFANAGLDILPHAPQMFPDGTVIYGVSPENVPVIADLVGSNDFEFVALDDDFTVMVLDEDMVVLYGRIHFTILDHEHGGTLRTLHNVQTEMFRRNPQMPRGWEFVYEQIGYRTPLLGEQKSQRRVRR